MRVGLSSSGPVVTRPSPAGTLQREFASHVQRLRIGPLGASLYSLRQGGGGGVRRFNLPAAFLGRDQTQGSVEERGQPRPLRQRDPPARRAEESQSPDDAGIWDPGGTSHRTNSARKHDAPPAPVKSSIAGPTTALGRELRAALRSARRKEYRVVLELFAGDGGISHAVQTLGHAALPLDISVPTSRFNLPSHARSHQGLVGLGLRFSRVVGHPLCVLQPRTTRPTGVVVGTVARRLLHLGTPRAQRC